jgi:hypothetical protein
VKRKNPLVDRGLIALALGAIAFFPPLFGKEYLITSWLGNMEQPVGLSAMVVGGVLFAIGKLRQFRDTSPVISPTEPVAADGKMSGLGDPQGEERETPPAR